jgi:recombination protein RecA
MAVELGVIEKRGSYYYHEEESLAQGRENAKQALRENPDLADQIEAAVRDQLALNGARLPTADPDEEETPESVPEELTLDI